MNILRDISILWSLIHTLILFLFLFESRYPKKKTLILTLASITPLIIFNFVLFLILGAEKMSMLLLLTCTLPSLIIFWFLSKYRDGRFFFTFCMIDTVSLEILYLTNIINHYIPNETYLFLFISRLFAYPLLEWLIYKKLRPIYFDIQKNTKKGWYVFSAIGAILYIAISLSMSYPTTITERPDDIPSLMLLFLLMPMIYTSIFITLRQQQSAHESAEQKNILEIQVANMQTRMKELSEADEKFRMERHNFRHKMKAIATLVEKEQYTELRALVLEYHEVIKATQVKRYCQNAVIDAVLSTYLKKAESHDIKTVAEIALPDILPINEPELATVFANAIENAIHACEKLEPSERYLEVQILKEPCFMIQISNSFNGSIEFDRNGVPISHEDGHGFGTRSIVAFCEKYGAYYEFKADANKFSLRIAFG